MAALFNLAIPDTGARYPHQERNPVRLLADFSRCFVTLWRDKLGQISLAVTTLFWGAGAALQFIIIKWAEKVLHMPLDQGAMLQGISAMGIALGAVLAARYIPLKKAVNVLPVGIAMGVTVITLVSVRWMPFESRPLTAILAARRIASSSSVSPRAFLNFLGEGP